MQWEAATAASMASNNGCGHGELASIRNVGQTMSGKDGMRQSQPQVKEKKLDTIRQALERNGKPSDKFMRAFETLMRKDESGTDKD